MTVKFPGSPSRLLTSLLVMSLMLMFRPTSTSLGEIIHMVQSLVGEVLSRRAINPPMVGDFSTR